MIARLAALAILLTLLLASVAAAEPYDPPLSEQCAAILAEDPQELAAWLAERNGITVDHALEVVATATESVCT